MDRLRLISALLAASCAAPGHAQSTTSTPGLEILVQVLDGKSGKSLSTRAVSLDCFAGEMGCQGFHSFLRPLQEDPSGAWPLVLPANATALSAVSSWNDYEACNATFRFDLATIRSTGVVAQNTCGGHLSPSGSAGPLKPIPGHLVVFFHHKPWWVRIFPYC